MDMGSVCKDTLPVLMKELQIRNYKYKASKNM